jgi:hypothetical protein
LIIYSKNVSTEVASTPILFSRARIRDPDPDTEPPIICRRSDPDTVKHGPDPPTSGMIILRLPPVIRRGCQVAEISAHTTNIVAVFRRDLAKADVLQ